MFFSCISTLATSTAPPPHFRVTSEHTLFGVTCNLISTSLAIIFEFFSKQEVGSRLLSLIVTILEKRCLQDIRDDKENDHLM